MIYYAKGDAMIYCDLSINDIVIWSGVPCLNGVSIKSSSYIPFSGNLIFFDNQKNSDPTYDQLGTRYLLTFISATADPATSTSFMQFVPLQPIPSQVVHVVLDGQNCTLSIYEKPTT